LVAAREAFAVRDNLTLASRLRATLDPELLAGRPVDVIDRAVPPHVGKRYRAEFVHVALGDERLDLFVKHGPAIDVDDPFKGGMPGGLSYEAVAHEQAQRTYPHSTARAYGLYVDGSGDATLLFERVILRHGEPAEPISIDDYAAWLGRFQRTYSLSARGKEREVFTITRSFLGMWLERAEATIHSLGFEALPPTTAALYEDDVRCLTTVDPVLLHGDFYSDNVLQAADGTLRIIDWELAAMGAGEIDLATLLLGRSDRTQQACVAAYVESRYDHSAPRLIARRLLAARTYVLLRILSIPPRPERTKRYLRRLRLLRELLEEDR
jgi:hypothetical protein